MAHSISTAEQVLQLEFTNGHFKLTSASRMFEDLRRGLDLLENRYSRIRAISSSMSNDPTDRKEFLGSNQQLEKHKLTDEQVFATPLPARLQKSGRYFTWTQLLERFPKPSCNFKGIEEHCTDEELQRKELFTLAKEYVTTKDNSILPAIEDLLESLEVDVLTEPSFKKTQIRDKADSAISVGIRLLGIVISLFSGLSYAGILGGPSKDDINDLIFENEGKNVDTLDTEEPFENLPRGTNTYSERPKNQEEVLLQYVRHAELVQREFNEVVRKWKRDSEFIQKGYYKAYTNKKSPVIMDNAIDSYVGSITHALDQYISYAHLLANSFEKALGGSVPMELFPPQEVYKSISSLDNKKADSYSLIFDDNYEDVPQFYSLKTYVTTHPADERTFVITVLVPMVNSHETYGLYEYHNDPIFVGPRNLNMKLNPENTLIMSDTRHSVTRELTAEDLTTCTKVSMKYLCPDIKLFISKESCMKALFKNDQGMIFATCEFSFDKQEGTLIKRYAPDEYIFRTNRTHTIRFNCAGIKKSITHTLRKGQTRLRIPPGCSSTIDNSYISTSGEMTVGDARVGHPFMHFPLVDNYNVLFTYLQKRYKNIDFTEKGREMILRDIIKIRHPIVLRELNEEIKRQGARPLEKFLMIAQTIMAVIVVLTVFMTYILYVNLPAKFSWTEKKFVEVTSTPQVHTTRFGDHEEVSPQPNYRAPRLTDLSEQSPDFRRTLRADPLIRPLMDSVRAFRPEQFRRRGPFTVNSARREEADREQPVELVVSTEGAQEASIL